MFILTVAALLLFNAYSDSFGHFEAIIADDVTTTLRVEPTSNDEENLAENHEDGCKDEDESDCTAKNSTINLARILALFQAILLEFCTNAIKKSAPVFVETVLSSYSSGASAKTPNARPK